MYKFTITNGYLNIQNTENGNQVLNVPRAIVASNLLELYSVVPAACLYNSFCDNQNIFRKPLSECVDSTDTPFTADSFTEFCQTNLGFNTPGATGEITVVTNYSALPDPTTVPEEFYWCENSQGTSWLPGSLGGTYYNSGLYYSNGVSWTFMNVPYQATQSEVNTGTNTDKFITPSTFENASKWNSKQDKPQILNLTSDYTLTSSTSAQKLFNVGTGGNGAFDATASTIYEFELFVDLSTLSSTSGFFSFSLTGTATYNNLRLKTSATKSVLITGAVFDGVITSASAYQLITANTATVGTIVIKGLINVNGAGTVIPTITLSQASAGVVLTNSYCKLTKI